MLTNDGPSTPKLIDEKRLALRRARSSKVSEPRPMTREVAERCHLVSCGALAPACRQQTPPTSSPPQAQRALERTKSDRSAGDRMGIQRLGMWVLLKLYKRPSPLSLSVDCCSTQPVRPSPVFIYTSERVDASVGSVAGPFSRRLREPR